MHPAYKHLPTGQQHLWATTEDGVAYTTDGAANWTVISEATLGTPVNDAGDSPAPTAANLENIDLAFCPQDPRRVYVLRTWASPKRTWLYKTDDYGATWVNAQVNA
jgi:Neuraminidase (sialidase)